MKLTSPQMKALVEKVFNEWKKANQVVFKEDEKKVVEKAIEHLKADFKIIEDLERDVNAMMDSLERSNNGEFQRYKMFPLLKAKLAKERKIVL